MGGQLGLPRRRGSRSGWIGRYLPWLFWACAAVLTPWVVFLYLTQLPVGQAHQIRLLAVGLIIAVMAAIAATAWTYHRGSPWSVLTAAFAATAAFISAWFRGLSEVGGSHWAGAIPVLLVVVTAVIALCVLVIRSGRAGRGRMGWLPVALTVAAMALLPPLIVALSTVPAVQTAHHLRLAWTGLDVFEVVALAATGFALQHRPATAVVPATVTGTLLLCDAWINIVPVQGVAFYEALAMGLVEIPLAALSFWVAAHALS